MTRRGREFFQLGRSDTAPRNLRVICSTGPDLIINAAGYVGKPNVDACKGHESELLRDNALMPWMLSAYCDLHNIPLIHFSSGCLYAGRRPDGYGWRETDAPNFLDSFYVRTKALGEERLQLNSYTIRLRLPFSDDDDPRSLLSKFRSYPKLLDAENSISHLGDAVKAALDLHDQRAPYGIYHAVNPDPIWHHEIVKMMGLEKEWWDWEEFYMGGNTPRSNCVLDTTKLQALVHVRPVREALKGAIHAFS